MVKGKQLFVWLICLGTLLCLLCPSATAAKLPSQAGERKLEGGQWDFLWPVPGAYNLSSCFLDNRAHYSLDIAAPTGTKVVASYAGKIIDTFTGCEHNWGKTSGSDCSCTNWGNFVLMQHDYELKSGEHITLYSRYAHLTKVSVSQGQQVAAGEKIGTIGSTGYSSGPHLDYEILYGGTYPGSTYSLDPYINDLLEIPEELHTTFGKCCQEYVAYVKTLAVRCQHSSYDTQGKCKDCGYAFRWQDTWDPDSMGNYTVTEMVAVAALPYAAEEENYLEKGQAVSVSATVVNGLGESWYEITWQEKTGYVPASALSFSSYFDSEIKGTLSTLENGQILRQESHRLDGRITSKYPLRALTGYLNGEKYATWSGKGGTRQVDLRGTALNKKLSFSQLTPGEYILTITAEDSTQRGAVEIIRCTFTVEAPPAETVPEAQPTEPPTQPETLPPATEPPTTAPLPTAPETVPTAPETQPPASTPPTKNDGAGGIWIGIGISLGVLAILAIFAWRFWKKTHQKGLFSKEGKEKEAPQNTP